jgi:hypothetical protein
MQEYNMVESRGAKLFRWFVKLVFIGCYAAFMWASVHHVAYFFNNFEEGSKSQIGFGSYVLAGAFDLTALITTIAVMFFRKNMSFVVLLVVWIFILAIAGYSFLINWEYVVHFQGADLTLEPTGATTPVYDQAGNLHYVPVMQQDQRLLVLNPLLASGFVLFSLIYSIVAEFFGTKPPSVQELEAQRDYLRRTKAITDEIQQLAENKGPGLIARAKQTALEVKEAVAEVTKQEGEEEAAPKPKKGLFGWGQNKQVLEQMRTLLVAFGWKTVEQARKLKLEEAQLLLVALGLWDVAAGKPTEAVETWKLLRAEAQARGWLTVEQIGQEASMSAAQIQARYMQLGAQLEQARRQEEQQRLEVEAAAQVEVLAAQPGPAQAAETNMAVVEDEDEEEKPTHQQAVSGQTENIHAFFHQHSVELKARYSPADIAAYTGWRKRTVENRMKRDYSGAPEYKIHFQTDYKRRPYVDAVELFRLMGLAARDQAAASAAGSQQNGHQAIEAEEVLTLEELASN